VLLLAETAGLHGLLDQQLSVDSPAATVKTSCVIAGMLAGADSIDDLDLLRHGGMARLFCGVRAPSTLGTFLRRFTHGHVQQLRAVGSRLLTGLTAQVPGLLAGADRLAFVDVDDTIGEVHGYAKQAAAYGYSKVMGLNVQLATVSTPLAAPVIAQATLRAGNTASATGAGRMLAQAITTARAAGATGQILARADSAYYGWAFVGTALRAKAWFSVTARMTATVAAAITSIAEDAWIPIHYPNAVWDEVEHRLVSDAEVAEIGFTAFTSRKKSQQVLGRLVVRRIPDLNPKAVAGQPTLFDTWRFHAFFTTSTLDTVTADKTHRGHAIIEQVHADLKDSALAHLPSKSYAANSAWLVLAVIAFNLSRAAAALSGPRLAKATTGTIRRTLIVVPARIAASARTLTLHLPTGWPWRTSWTELFTHACGPPATTA